jgi:hypothetical protein
MSCDLCEQPVAPDSPVFIREQMEHENEIAQIGKNRKAMTADILKLQERQHEMYVDIRKLENYVNTVICFFLAVFMFEVIIFVTR